MLASGASTMRTLFVMDPLSSLNYAQDSTWMLMREATRRGIEVAWCTPNDLFARDSAGWARAQTVKALDGAPYFEEGPWEDALLGSFDVIWQRKDPPFDMSYIFTTYLLDFVPRTTLVLNRPDGLRARNEKLFAFTFSDLTPPTLLTRDLSRVMAFAQEQAAREDGRIVLKPWDGNGGRGVLVSRAGDPNLRSMVELLTGDGRHFILCQRYLPEIRQGDKRILLVDGEPVGAMLRVPAEDDNRGNMHAGATVVATQLTEREREICGRIGAALRQEGFLFVGIDIIGGYLTEINVTSPTGIQQINQLDGVQIERLTWDAALRWHQQLQE